MHHPKDRITHTMAFVTPVVEHWLEREIAQWVHPMKDRSDDPPHHVPGGRQEGTGQLKFVTFYHLKYSSSAWTLCGCHNICFIYMIW